MEIQTHRVAEVLPELVSSFGDEPPFGATVRVAAVHAKTDILDRALPKPNCESLYVSSWVPEVAFEGAGYATR